MVEPIRDRSELRARECNRVSAQDAALDNELDDLLLSFEDDDDIASAARDAEALITKCAKAFESPMAAEVPPDPADVESARLLADYWFPDTAAVQLDVALLTDSDLTQALNALVKAVSRSVPLAPYHVIRERYCAISVVMNERGCVPPRFRLQRPLPRKQKDATPGDTLMMRDRQIIDMHWLHCRGKRDALPDRAFAELFVGDELDFDLAAFLAEKSWTSEAKAEKVLNLIPHEQLQLACLRTRTINDAWRNSEKSMKTTIDRRLREQLVAEPSLKPHVEDLKLLWLADKMVGMSGLAAVAQMHGWLSGKAPLSISTLHGKLRRMRRRTVSGVGKT